MPLPSGEAICFFAIIQKRKKKHSEVSIKSSEGCKYHSEINNNSFEDCNWESEVCIRLSEDRFRESEDRIRALSFIRAPYLTGQSIKTAATNRNPN
jgi:hypothetical protein